MCIFYPYKECNDCGECTLCCQKFLLDYDNIYVPESCVHDFNCESCTQKKCYCCSFSTVIKTSNNVDVIVCTFRKDDVLL